jgi:hypothetical protein
MNKWRFQRVGGSSYPKKANPIRSSVLIKVGTVQISIKRRVGATSLADKNTNNNTHKKLNKKFRDTGGGRHD